METAVQVAIIAAGTAITIVSAAILIALGYGIYILRHVLESVRDFKRTAKEITSDVKGAVKSAIGITSRTSKG